MSVTYPALLFGGAALVLVPILIHLLNKRKFKIVDWAAMDFLFEADKKNRRRVRLEDLLILLLRVLAVLLLAGLLARPFLTSASATVLGGKVGFERIVLLDDSPSMETRQQGPSALTHGRRMAAELVRELGAQHTSDTLTVVLTSRPSSPVVREAVLTPDTVNRLASELASWPASSRPAHYEQSLSEVEKLISTKTTNLNRIVYIISDMRRGDWHTKQQAESPKELVATLRRLADKTAGCYLVDVGGPREENLAITSLV
ncbi:MAG: BatA domain-containing protein, partial [Planctomycetota bacterium]|nr:BatA domain-containing protein [Planctomycetota bacterium]